MNKCRICLKQKKALRLISDKENNITFQDMLTSLNIKIYNINTFPDKLCLSCRKRLREAYNFKIDAERSEVVLNETVNHKRIHFNNISDVKIKIEDDCKPVVPVINYFSEDLLDTFTQNETIIKKIKQFKNEDQKAQITVKEFLNSVKMESGDDDCNDNDYQLEAEYDLASDSDYEYHKPIKTKKKTSKQFKNKGNCHSKNSEEIQNVIKPILLKDVKIDHSHFIRRRQYQPKKKRNPSKTSICPYCGKVLLSYNLDVHMLHHTSDRPFKCEQCSKTFVTEQNLRMHKKRHSKDSLFKCNQCIATFNMKDSLKTHMLVHSDEKNYICNICNKAFKRKRALTRHMDIHKFGKKAVPCELCPMTFHSQEFLRHHMRVHTGERPFKCEICSQPYSYKHDFNRHCFKKHGVYLNRRSVKIMNEDVLQHERSLMKELALRSHGFIKDDKIPSVFSGPQGIQAFQQAMAVAAKQIPITGMDTTYNIST